MKKCSAYCQQKKMQWDLASDSAQAVCAVAAAPALEDVLAI